MKKIVKIILIFIIIIGIICMATLKFNIGLKYSNNVQLGVNIGKDFDIKDIKSIASEVFENQRVIVQYIELYRDMVKITVEDATDEQIELLNNKINEEYEIENEVSSIEVTKNDGVDLKNLVKQIAIPVAISAIIIMAYAMCIFRKIGVWAVLYRLLIALVGTQAILMSVYAIVRLPVNNITPIVSIVVYISTVLSCMMYFQREKERLVTK